MSNQLKCPYLGCQKEIPLTEDFTCHRPVYTICPHCGQPLIVNISVQPAGTIPAPIRPMDYIQNPDNKGAVGFEITKKEDAPEGGSIPPPFMRP